jgi:hypothetical protein
VTAAHWRHPVEDYPLTGDEANFIVRDTVGLQTLAHYSDDDVVIDVFANGGAESVAARTGCLECRADLRPREHPQMTARPPHDGRHRSLQRVRDGQATAGVADAQQPVHLAAGYDDPVGAAARA